MSSRRLIAILLLFAGSLSGSADDAGADVYVVHARTTHPDVKLVRYITDFPGSYPATMLKNEEYSVLYVRSDKKNIAVASKPPLPESVLDSLTEWIVPFNPMSVDTFMVAVRVTPLRFAIRAALRDLGSPHSRLVSIRPWFRKDTSRLTGKGQPGMNDIPPPFTEPTYNLDTLGSRIIYPPAARGRDLEGFVLVAVMVDIQGFAEEVVIVQSSHNVFDLAAARACKTLRYQPGTAAGVPTRMWVLIPISFSPN